MMGIGQYKCNYNDNGVIKRLLHLNEMSIEYTNMLKLFVRRLNYSFVYQTDDNKIAHLAKSKLIKNQRQYHSNFKLKWTSDEIDTFISNIKKIFHKLKPSGLIFIIAARGFMDKMIVDSDGEKYRMIKIFSQFNNTNQGCPDLASKTKLFVLDLCTLDQNKDVESVANDEQNKDATNSSKYDKSNDDKEDKESNETEMNDNESNFKDLNDYKDFCIIYKNSKILKEEYKTIAANCLLLQSLRNVFKQLDNGVMEFSHFVEYINYETVGLMVNENIAWKDNYEVMNDNTINIWQCPECDLYRYELKNKLNAILNHSSLDKMFLLGNSDCHECKSEIILNGKKDDANEYLYHKCVSNMNGIDKKAYNNNGVSDSELNDDDSLSSSGAADGTKYVHLAHNKAFIANSFDNKLKWQCSHCTFMNDLTKNKCCLCGSAREWHAEESNAADFVRPGETFNLNAQYHEDAEDRMDDEDWIKLYERPLGLKLDEQRVNNRDEFASNSSKYMGYENSHKMEMKFENCAQTIVTFNDNCYELLTTLGSVAKKLLTKTELKYRKLDTQNAHVVSKLLKYDGVLDYLKALGFEKQANGSALIVNKLNKPLIKHGIIILKKFRIKMQGNIQVKKSTYSKNNRNSKPEKNSTNTTDAHDELLRSFFRPLSVGSGSKSAVAQSSDIDAKADDLHTSSDTLIKNLDDIIGWATHPNRENSESINTLLLTYPIFTDSITLANRLIHHYTGNDSNHNYNQTNTI